jgi:hypothetical protein
MNTALSILEQVEVAFRPGNRRAAWVALPLGALIPIATYFHAHAVRWDANLLAQGSFYLALGGLLYSGLTVYSWMHSVTSVGAEDRLARAGAVTKALGFVALAEGTLAYAPSPAVSWAMLALLVVVNAIALQCTMVTTRAAARANRRVSSKRAPKAVVTRLRAAS